MIVIKKKEELKEKIKELKGLNKKIGFAPTMGYLHQGHLTLFEVSKSNCDITVTSIFVNPAQFNDPKDFEKYPRNTEVDLDKCKNAGVDIVYLPEVEDIYPDGKIPDIIIAIPHLMKNLCAVTRPGHFEGVLLVISNLFHAVNPDYAYFGKKDYQQFLLIKEFSKVTGFTTKVIGVETIREGDGLAMSSRNARLSAEERNIVSLIPQAFRDCEKYISSGGRELRKLKEIYSTKISQSDKLKIDYLEVLDSGNLNSIDSLKGEVLIAVAIFCGEVRLIDNIRLTVN